MATVKLSDIEGMVDKEPISKTERLARELLEVFVPDRPLDQEEFEEWIEINSLSAEEVKEAAREAMRRRWVEDTPEGLLLTDFGRQKKEE
jgi:coproporphyrinogen III oxidase-like Fe-S oxidoreductase